MSQQSNQWKGKGYIASVRQSDDKDGGASTEAQLAYLDLQCTAVGMHYVDKSVGEGLTGSLPGKRSDLDALLQRKREKNDFEVIAVQVEDRLTRGGGTHGMWFEHECLRHGISLFFAGDDVPKGPYSSMVRVAKYEAAREVAVNIAKRSTQGQTLSQKTGFFRTPGHTPFGCYRIYFGHDDKARYILRNLTDGRQEQLDPDTQQVISTFGTIGSKSRNRFKKQRNEYSLLIPGDPEQIRVVRIIFYLRYKRGWRGLRIADFLNRNGVLSPRGKSWSQRQVDCIYENEAYTGFLYTGQTYAGRFVRRDRAQGFVVLDRDDCVMATATHFNPVFLPMETWEKSDQPGMHGFLPEDVRMLAIEAQEKIWRHRADPARPKMPKNRYPSSSYLLSNRLVAKQDGEALVGTLSGNRGKQVPYYRHKRGMRGRLRGSVYNHLIPAEPLHTAILDLIGEVLADLPQLRATVIEMITEHRSIVRTERFVSLLQVAEKDDFFNKPALIELQNHIVDERFKDQDYRANQNYVGESVSWQNERVHFVSPKPGDLVTLMDGMIRSHERMNVETVHAVVHAAAIAYGFVFMHPFEDGNGRIHRFLIHNILSRRGFTPAGIMFPVSAVMLKRMDVYDASLEAFSKLLMPLIEYAIDDRGRMTIHNETADYYRYIDLTAQAEALFEFIKETIEVELVEELQFLVNYDNTKQAIKEIVDMPDRLIDLFIRFCLQNHGKLSSRKREEFFAALSDDEVAKMEDAVQKAYRTEQS